MANYVYQHCQLDEQCTLQDATTDSACSECGAGAASMPIDDSQVLYTTPSRRRLTGKDIPTAESYINNFAALVETEEVNYINVLAQSTVGSQCSLLCLCLQLSAEKCHGYMAHQPDLDTDSRATVVDWMCGVLERWNPGSTSLPLAVSILDRFLAAVTTTKARLQLTALASLWIAYKFVEGDDMTAAECVRCCPRMVDAAALIRMEGEVCRVLKYRISAITADCFIEKYCGESEDLRFLASYCCDIALVDYTFLLYSSAEVAAACLNVAVRTLQTTTGWTQEWAAKTGFTTEKLWPIIKRLEKLCRAVTDGRVCRYIFAKYSNERFGDVARLSIALLPATA